MYYDSLVAGSTFIFLGIFSTYKTTCAYFWHSDCCLCWLLNISASHTDRHSTRRLTTSSCSMGATSTTPAVPISGLTVWSPNPQASSCLTCSEFSAAAAMVTRHGLIKSSDRWRSRSHRTARALGLDWGWQSSSLDPSVVVLFFIFFLLLNSETSLLLTTVGELTCHQGCVHVYLLVYSNLKLYAQFTFHAIVTFLFFLLNEVICIGHI